MKPQHESLRHREAFEYYYAIGDGRSLEKVAAKFSVSRVAAFNWSAQFGWSDRVRVRDKEVAQRIEEQSKTDIVTMKMRQLKITRGIQAAFVERLRSKKVSPRPADFLAAAEYEARLVGYDPESPNASREDIAEVIRLVLYVLHTKLPDACPHCGTLTGMKGEIANELLRLSKHFAEPSSPATPPAQDPATMASNRPETGQGAAPAPEPGQDSPPPPEAA